MGSGNISGVLAVGRVGGTYGDQSKTVNWSYFYAENRPEGIMREILLQTYVAILPALMGYIVWLLKRQKKDRDANSRGTMLLLRVQLIEYHKEWMERGYITKHGIENFLEMYKAYHSLGGNGMVTRLLEEVEELPIKN